MKKLIYIALAVVLLAGCRSSREAARTGADRQGGAADSAAQEPQREYSVVNFTATVMSPEFVMLKPFKSVVSLIR